MDNRNFRLFSIDYQSNKLRHNESGYFKIFTGLFLLPFTLYANPPQKENPATIGVYYFDGWSGKNRHADNPDEPWQKTRQRI